MNILFVLSFEHDNDQRSYKRYFLPRVKIKDCNVMINRQIFFDKPAKNDLRTYENIRKIATGQGDDYTTGCLVDYPYCKEYYMTIAIDVDKKQALDAYLKAAQKINLTGILNQDGRPTMFFILKNQKKPF